jgi:hypothetical protein
MILDKVRLILTVITIAINVVPITGVLLIYRNNLLGLVVPPEISTLVNDPSTILNDPSIAEESLGNLTFVDSQYDATSRTVTATFQFTNPFKFDLTVDSMTADIQCDAHDFPMGHAIISNPVDVLAGETATIDVVGTWTQDAINHFQTAHVGARSIDIELVGLVITVNGISVQTDERVKIPNFPIA